VANQRLIHDVAVATSKQVLAVFAPCLREEEQRGAFEEIYARIKAGIECFEIESTKMMCRLRPGRN
jgi:hypothetical protein